MSNFPDNFSWYLFDNHFGVGDYSDEFDEETMELLREEMEREETDNENEKYSWTVVEG